MFAKAVGLGLNEEVVNSYHPNTLILRQRSNLTAQDETIDLLHKR